MQVLPPTGHTAEPGTGNHSRTKPTKTRFLPRRCVATAIRNKTTTPGTRCNYNVFLCVRVFFRSREPGRGVLCTILPTTTPGNCVPALLTEPTRPRPPQWIDNTRRGGSPVSVNISGYTPPPPRLTIPARPLFATCTIFFPRLVCPTGNPARLVSAPLLQVGILYAVSVFLWLV